MSTSTAFHQKKPFVAILGPTANWLDYID